MSNQNIILACVVTLCFAFAITLPALLSRSDNKQNSIDTSSNIEGKNITVVITNKHYEVSAYEEL